MTLYDPPLSQVRVGDVMHTGILTTDPTTPLRVVAQLMADNRVHAIAVADPDHARRPLGFITVLDVAGAVIDSGEPTAGEAAATEVVSIPSTASVEDAARRMVEHAVNHLIVIDAATGHPSGILSGLDIAAAYAGS